MILRPVYSTCVMYIIIIKKEFICRSINALKSWQLSKYAKYNTFDFGNLDIFITINVYEEFEQRIRCFGPWNITGRAN
jgi:hypothetical protein